MRPPVYRPVHQAVERIFFSSMAILISIVVVIGFAFTDYAAGRLRAPLHAAATLSSATRWANCSCTLFSTAPSRTANNRPIKRSPFYAAQQLTRTESKYSLCLWMPLVWCVNNAESCC